MQASFTKPSQAFTHLAGSFTDIDDTSTPYAAGTPDVLEVPEVLAGLKRASPVTGRPVGWSAFPQFHAQPLHKHAGLALGGPS